MEQLRVINRTSQPTKQDTLDYLTICVTDECDCEFWIQLSKDCENPKWEKIGYCNLAPIDNITDLLLRLIDLLK